MSIGQRGEKLDRPGPAGPPALDGAALALLLDERERALRGVAHALSNRVGTVVTVAAMLAPGAPVAAPLAAALADEAERLEGVLGLVRLLAGEPDAGAEPVHLPAVLEEVARVAAEHPAVRDAGCAAADASAGGEAPPAVARPARLREALLLLAGVGARAGAVTLRPGRDGERAAVEVETAVGASADDPPTAAAAARAAAWLLAPDGTAAVSARGWRVTLPALGGRG